MCQKKGQIDSSAELHSVFWQGGLAEQREAPVHNVEEEEDQGEGQSVRTWTFHRDCCSYKCWWVFFAISGPLLAKMVKKVVSCCWCSSFMLLKNTFCCPHPRLLVAYPRHGEGGKWIAHFVHNLRETTNQATKKESLWKVPLPSSRRRPRRASARGGRWPPRWTCGGGGGRPRGRRGRRPWPRPKRRPAWTCSILQGGKCFRERVAILNRIDYLSIREGSILKTARHVSNS